MPTIPPVCVLAVVLMLAGAVAELGGLGLVVLDIQSARRHARALASQGFEQALPVTAVVGRAEPSGAETGTPTQEQRIEALERDLHTLGEWTENRLKELRERVSSVAMGVADRQMEAHLLEERIRGFLREILTADLGRRKVGAVLIAVGIVLALAGNLVSLLAL